MVRMLFQRYLDTRSITRMVDELAAEGVRTKLRTHVTGQTIGGVPFTRGSLSQLLQNPLYMGKVRHKRELFEGEFRGTVLPKQPHIEMPVIS